MDEYSKIYPTDQHRAGAFSNNLLREIENYLPMVIENSAETGCGKSTILFSNISNNHTVFTVDDSQSENSSVNFFRECTLTKLDKIKTVFGPTQNTLTTYSEHTTYDVVLLDGPHGYPFPDFEYLIFYPYIKERGILIIDDVHIPTIGRMADVIAEDAMWKLLTIVGNTALFQRTSEKTFNNRGDGWWTQIYNRRRSPFAGKDIYLNDGLEIIDKVSSRYEKS